jgi:hypothetical protein
VTTSESKNTSSPTQDKVGSKINYYVLVAMITGIIIFAFANSYEPNIFTQADFFEIILTITPGIAGVAGLLVAKRYLHSKVFGRAYLALGIGFLLWCSGNIVFTIMNVTGTVLPYPGPPDLFFVPYYLFVLFHLTTCVRYFKKRFSLQDKLTIILIPLVINIVYIFALLVPVSIPGSVPDLLSQQVTIGEQTFKLVPVDDPSVRNNDYQRITVGNETFALEPLELTSTAYPSIPQSNSPVDLAPLAFERFTIGQITAQFDSQFWPPFLAGIYYNAISTINLSFAIVGMTIFRNSALGAAWGLLLLGIALIAVADIIFDFSTIYAYDRTGPSIDFYVFGASIVVYALIIHRRIL